MNKDMKPFVFVASPEDRVIAQDCCKEVIESIEKHTKKNIGLKCFVVQMLLESFEETYNIDIRNGMSFKHG